MEFIIVADSSCDLTPDLRKRLGVISVPLNLTLNNESYADDEHLDLNDFMLKMKNCTGRVGSSAPAPALFLDKFKKGCTSFVITLSSNLSSTFANAVIAKSMAEEDDDDTNVHVFDSKSASAAETLIALKLRTMIEEGISRSRIISSIESFIKDMKTYFVLDNLDNLLKNGRLNKVVGKVISLLNIKPVMSADHDGHIQLASHARGQNQLIEKLSDMIRKSGKKTDGESIVISHCNNPTLAEQLMEVVKSRYNFKEVLIVPTKGLSSLYANEKGIVMAF